MKRFLFALLLVADACAPVRRGAEGSPISRGVVRGSKNEGPWTLFLPDRHRLLTAEFVDGAPHGTCKLFHADGSLRQSATLVHGVHEGPARMFHANGRLESRGSYVAGVCEGPWVWYSVDGSVDAARTGYYRAGIRIE